MKNIVVTKAFGLAYCFAAYMCAGVLIVLISPVLHGLHPLLAVLIADCAAMLVVFLFSVFSDNSSVYDPYWSIIPIPIALYFALVLDAPLWRIILIAGIVSIWGLRLTGNWIRRWKGLSHEDWRYADFRQSSGRWYWLVSLLGIHGFPTLIVFAGCLSLFAAFASSAPFGVFDILGAFVAIAAVVIEAVSDEVLSRSIRTGKKGALCEHGLWRYARHPNYFGEVLFWWGLWLFSLARFPEYWWTSVGPVAMTLLFVFISVPMIDRHMAKRPGYARRMKLSPLVPLPRR
ncbi:MAG: DUF1295 domain-containing protein [Spirochaetota bacterium]